MQSESDFKNLVEFWYSIRNNLFHGEKNPSLERDREIVKLGFLTLSFFVENVLLKLKEMTAVYPNIWEDFWHKFKNGEVKIVVGSGQGSKTIGGVCECVFLEKDCFPLVIFNKLLSKGEILEMINKDLWSGRVGSKRIILKLKKLAKTDKQIEELKRSFGGLFC